VQRMKKSRSQVFSDAVMEYVVRHASETLSHTMDRVCGGLGNSADKLASSAAQKLASKTAD